MLGLSEERAMILKEFRASRATQSLVRAYRLIHLDVSGIKTAPVKYVAPAPEITLGFSLREREVMDCSGSRIVYPQVLLSGVHDFTNRVPCPRHFMLLQIAFQPGAAQRLIGMSPDLLFNQQLDAVGILGSEVLRVHGRLENARSYSEIIAIADAYIAGLADRRRPGRDFKDPLRLLRENPGISIDWLADQASLSLRQFERCCQDHTGMTPKAYARLSRFSRAFGTRINHPKRDWLTIAIDCGYFDYQHMVRDFLRFTDQTPPRALALQSTAPESLLGMTHEFDISYPGARQPILT
jgi:AraC-like DNA-binding protein